MATRQKHIEQYSRSINIRGCGHGLALQLLGRGILRSHRSAAFDRKRRFRVLAVAFEELGYSEVEEFCLAVGPHQDVRRFQVAMDDVMDVSLRHSFQGIEEQPNARPDFESVLIAVSVDGFAINVLQYEEGLAR